MIVLGILDKDNSSGTFLNLCYVIRGRLCSRKGQQSLEQAVRQKQSAQYNIVGP
jgi:hypothetical protein